MFMSIVEHDKKVCQDLKDFTLKNFVLHIKEKVPPNDNKAAMVTLRTIYYGDYICAVLLNEKNTGFKISKNRVVDRTRNTNCDVIGVDEISKAIKEDKYLNKIYSGVLISSYYDSYNRLVTVNSFKFDLKLNK